MEARKEIADYIRLHRIISRIEADKCSITGSARILGMPLSSHKPRFTLKHCADAIKDAVQHKGESLDLHTKAQSLRCANLLTKLSFRYL